MKKNLINGKRPVKNTFGELHIVWTQEKCLHTQHIASNVFKIIKQPLHPVSDTWNDHERKIWYNSPKMDYPKKNFFCCSSTKINFW